MPNLYFSWKKTLPLLAVMLLFPTLNRAQNSDPMFDRMEQLFQRMQQQMLKGIPMDSTMQGGQFYYSPDSSSSFFYHVDTSFNGIGDSHFFQFSPFGNPGQGGMPDMDSLFEQFFNRASPFDQRQGLGDFPADDGNKSPGDDELLPEERLRLQEENPDTKTKPAPPAEKPLKSTVKTIRI